MPDQNEPSRPGIVPWFTSTHWSVVVNAQAEDSLLAAEALGKLCEAYWRPVHSYVRSRGQNATDADDLTQQFFARFLEKGHIQLADRNRGRFRSFLLTAVKHFLINEWERASAKKRGGGQLQVSLDEPIPGDDRPRIELVDEHTAARSYEQTWALALIERVRVRIAAEYSSAGKVDRFALLEKFLPGEESEMTYAMTAERLGVAEGTIKSDVHRLKRRYREVLREEIAHTVATPAEIDDELRYLIVVLGQPRA
jgi:RNA polymerase sigma factor (sigma-70 family)